MITQEEITEALNIDIHGTVTHNKTGSRWDGMRVGTKHHTGYIVHTIKGKQYGLHRLVFMYFHGYMPVAVDHYDQDKANNKISNLVPSNATHNGMNRKLNKNNTSGHIGVLFDKRRNRWKAQIKVNAKQMSLGNFKTIEEAVACRAEAEVKHGFSKLHGASNGKS